MKASDIRKKKDADLQKELVKLRESLREASFNTSGSAKGFKRSEVKKDIARIMTELTSRKRAEETADINA